MNQTEFWAYVARREAETEERELVRAEREARHVAGIEAGSERKGIEGGPLHLAKGLLILARWLFFGYVILLVNEVAGVGAAIVGILVCVFCVKVLRGKIKW